MHEVSQFLKDGNKPAYIYHTMNVIYGNMWL